MHLPCDVAPRQEVKKPELLSYPAPTRCVASDRSFAHLGCRCLLRGAILRKENGDASLLCPWDLSKFHYPVTQSPGWSSRCPTGTPDPGLTQPGTSWLHLPAQASCISNCREPGPSSGQLGSTPKGENILSPWSLLLPTAKLWSVPGEPGDHEMALVGKATLTCPESPPVSPWALQLP